MYRDIRHKLKQQRAHLVSMQRFLIKQIELENEIIGFVQTSEAQLNQALQLENSSSAHINSLREKLANDQRLYTECIIFIGELQTDIATTKTAIEKTKLKLHHLFFPKKTSGFVKQKNETSQVAHFSH